MTQIEVRPNENPTPDAERERILADPGFGRFFTDHMVQICWSADRDWYDAAVVPYGPISLNPATSSIHYGQSVFEGLKAYRWPDGSINSFRPDRNAERFQRSAARLAMPELPTHLFMESLHALVSQDADWVPSGDDRSLYLRPFMFSTGVGLGVRPSDEYVFMLIASPAGAYFPRGVKPVSVWLTEDYVRAVPGGTGEAKCAGNYAASLLAQAEAMEHGCDQVVWLDAIEHKVVEEMGGMNLYFVYGQGEQTRLVTPELTGSLLPGVTRESLLAVAADRGYDVSEGTITVDQWRADAASGELTEVFACGTAAVITPVGSVRSHRHSWLVGGGEPGPVTMGLRQDLLNLQTGHAPDPRGWMHQLVPAPGAASGPASGPDGHQRPGAAASTGERRWSGLAPDGVA